MPFRWFKQHEKTLMYFVAFFIVPTFLIGIGAYAFFGNIGRTKSAAKFELVPGDPTVVSMQEIQDLARRRNNQNIPSLAAWKAAVDEAKLAGIYVSDKELRDAITATLEQNFPAGYTTNQYKGLAAANGMSISQFERTVREQIAVSRLFAFKSTDRRSTSKEVFDAWARDNTKLTVDYIAFRADDLKGEWDVFDITPEEVDEFYDRAKENPTEYGWALDRYTTPQMWDLEALFVQFEGFDEANHAVLLEGVEDPSEDELRSYYDRHIDWFTPEVEEPQGESGDEEEVEPTPFEDLEDEIRLRIRIERGMENVYGKLLEAQINSDSVDLTEFAGMQGVFYERYKDMTSDALETAEIIGYESLPIALSQLKTGDLSRGVISERPDGLFVLRVGRVQEPDFKPQKTVDVLLREDIIVERSRNAIQERTRELYDEMEAKIEEIIKAERGDTDEPKEDEDDDPAAEKSQEEQVADAVLEEEKRKRMGEAFDLLVAEKGLEVTRIGPAKFMRRGTPEYEAEEDPDKKYLFSNLMINTREEGRVEGRSLINRDTWTAYVIRMVEKGAPDPSEMPESEYETYLQQRLFTQFQQNQQLQQFREQQWLQQINLSGPGIPPAGGAPGS